ncbi:unnamed protein product [Moneuplotes crassus]|uniref:Uncharacterized protein n=1 Tax=Euplotes crassus TaxID=5936 RepID=A0AAD1XHM2_EUPCR|nr:unnamed protein product [Moneuplotes crassus]
MRVGIKDHEDICLFLIRNLLPYSSSCLFPSIRAVIYISRFLVLLKSDHFLMSNANPLMNKSSEDPSLLNTKQDIRIVKLKRFGTLIKAKIRQNSGDIQIFIAKTKYLVVGEILTQPELLTRAQERMMTCRLLE